MFQDVFIIGTTGKVGRTLVRQMFANNDVDSEKHENPTRIIGLASSSEFVHDFQGIGSRTAKGFTNGSMGGRKYYGLMEIFELMQEKYLPSRQNNLVFVDATTGGKELLELHDEIISESDYGIVTANKNPLVLSDFKTFNLLTKNVFRYGYRCSVMAGAYAVDFLRDARDLGDSLLGLEACLSGTLGFITTELHKRKNFSDILNDAYHRGYTEPNPADDLSGIDVGKKITILARTSGFDVNLEDVEVESFVPMKYLLEKDPEVLIKKMQSFDSFFREKVAIAEGKGNVLRYLARIDINGDKVKLRIGLVDVPRDSEFGILSGRINKVKINTDTYNENDPYIVSAPGAGLNVTARNIRRDLLWQLENRIAI